MELWLCLEILAIIFGGWGRGADLPEMNISHCCWVTNGHLVPHIIERILSLSEKKKRFLLSLHIITVKWMSCFVENFHSNILSGSLKLCSAWEIMWRFHPHWRVIRCLYSDSTQEDLNITKVLLHYAGVEKTVFVFNVLSFW